jgi:hypothetical protein
MKTERVQAPETRIPGMDKVHKPKGSAFQILYDRIHTEPHERMTGKLLQNHFDLIKA